MNTHLMDIRQRINIRPFKPDENDYEKVAAIWNIVWPEHEQSVDLLKFEDKTRDSKYWFERLVVELDGRMVAYGSYGEPSWMYKPDKYFIGGNVHPEFQKQGIGAALYDHVMDILMKKDPVEITVGLREDKADAIRFMENRGYKLVMRYPMSKLMLNEFDFDRYESVDENMNLHDIKIHTIKELGEMGVDWKAKSHVLSTEVLKDVPSPDPIPETTLEQYEKEFLNRPDFLPEANFIALDGDEFVGMSNIWLDTAKKEKLITGLTGVLRSHRRKGICTALKVHAIRFAKQYGAEFLETENEENNPMYQLNLQLGFKPEPAWTNYVKDIKEPPQ